MQIAEIEHYHQQLYHEAVECLKHSLKYMMFGWVFLCLSVYLCYQGSWGVLGGAVSGYLAWNAYASSLASRRVLVKMRALPIWLDILCVMMGIGAFNLVLFAFHVGGYV